MNWSDFQAVVSKEFTELRRDWAHFCVLFVLSASYPFMVLGVAEAAKYTKEDGSIHKVTVAVKGDVSLVRQQFLRDRINISSSSTDPQEELRLSMVDAVITIPAELSASVSTAASVPNITVEAKTGSEGYRALSIIENSLEACRSEIVKSRLSDLNREHRLAVDVQLTDTASRHPMVGSYVSISLPLLVTSIIVLLCTASAVDVVTGEKSRRTWVLLLVSPLDRHAILYGKLVTTVLVVTAALVVCLTSLLAVSYVGVHLGLSDSVGFSVQAALITALLCLPLSLVVTGLYFFLASCARTTQEANLYTSAALIVSMGLTMACVVPYKFIAPAMYLVPVVNVSICLSQALQIGINWSTLLLTIVSSAIFAVLCLYGCTQLINNEGLLWNVKVPTQYRRSYYSVVMLLSIAVFLLFFYLGQLMMAADVFYGTLATQSLVLVLPAVIAVWRTRLPIARTLSLRPVAWYKVLAGLLIAPATVAVAIGIAGAQNYILPVPSEYEKLMKQFILAGHPLWQTVIAMALTPGICEELLFRGAILGLLRRSVRPSYACILVGVLFGLFHLSAFRFLPTAVLGIALGFIVIRTRSILPAMALHASHNLLAILISTDESMLQPWMLLPAGISATIGLILLLINRGSPPKQK